jgi:RNA polymerase sigma-70 factor (ECF subfamily)
MFQVLARESDLLQRLTEGDEAAFRELYEYYQGRIFLFAYRFTKSKYRAEEVVQDVFLKLWERRSQIKIETNFASYLIRMARNHILDGLKRVALDKKMQQNMLASMQVLRSSTAEQLLQKELDRLLKQAVDNLSPQRRTVYLLSREEELTYEQIAEKLGISKNTVRNVMVNALQSIREEISNHPDLGLTIFLIAVILHAKSH